MRTVTLAMCGGLLALTSACASQAEAGRDLPPIAGASPVVTTIETPAAAAPTSSVPAPPAPPAPPALVDACVAYVPFAASTGNFYMQVIWDKAQRDPIELRSVCEQMNHDDPQGLQRIADEQQAVSAYLAAASKGTTPFVCAPGSVLGDDGFCIAQP